MKLRPEPQAARPVRSQPRERIKHSGRRHEDYFPIEVAVSALRPWFDPKVGSCAVWPTGEVRKSEPVEDPPGFRTISEGPQAAGPA